MRNGFGLNRKVLLLNPNGSLPAGIGSLPYGIRPLATEIMFLLKSEEPFLTGNFLLLHNKEA
jgi:hypothetical protein